MSIRALVAEDEKPAVDHLLKLLGASPRGVEVVGVCESVRQTLAWFGKRAPDLLFLDIHLADGSGFELVEQSPVRCPVIFTTAYEEYALRAFKVNSVDYLLKPVEAGELDRALGKYQEQGWKSRDDQNLGPRMDALVRLLGRSFKSRFVVQAGARIRSVDVERISCFYSLEGSTFLLEDTGKSYDLPHSLDQLEEQVDPLQFFRISRQCMVRIGAIEDIHTLSATRLKLVVRGGDRDGVVVSRRKVQEFKSWLEK
ncbi:MAG: LytTR family DNA-binding domain-containing protein [Bacteroidales bacterium]